MMEKEDKIEQNVEPKAATSVAPAALSKLKDDVKLSTTPPVVQTFKLAREIFSKQLNKYQLFREMERADPELYGDIQDFAHTVGACYVGVIVGSGETLDAKEELLLEKAKELATLYDLRSRFYIIGKHLIRDGNCVYCTDLTGTISADTSTTAAQLQQKEDQSPPETITNTLTILPMPYLSAVDELSQVNKTEVDTQIFEGNYYVLNEQNDTKRKVYPKNKVLAFKLEQEGEEVEDLMKRYTFNVWSESPLTALKLTVLYKRSSTLDDMSWRHRMLPREHHKIPLEAYIPENYSGTPEQKLDAAKTAAETELQAYAQRLQNIDPDQHYITSPEVEVNIVEPRSTTYKDPNESIEQQNRSIHRATGLPPMSGESRSSYAYGLIVASYATLRAKNVAEHIKAVFEPFLRAQLKLRSERGNYKAGGELATFTDEDVDKVSIKLQLVLDKDRSEMIRRAAMMTETGSFLKNEIRDEAGYPPLSEEDQAKTVEAPRSRGKTPGEVTGDEEQIDEGAIDWPMTPESSEKTRMKKLSLPTEENDDKNGENIEHIRTPTELEKEKLLLIKTMRRNLESEG